ncbi:glycosyltransferase family 4 protein [Gloeobacter kilaueensis]|uniref:Glycosyl transferase group 1 n=1 Tax=Gloeobacter kilaueensis (strain ATCC BAA-2537 / CCAP 1431/1 / ULC 316 / JS1) TaxID=1183438 RepID=U5QH49_GLOK1|nr:glycosyltransferase family 1 protein [Gloeobacter kilaueensis]AGY58266.1 glycosyl transferase group 1 [Gloeobacter kilaueensis JS1]
MPLPRTVVLNGSYLSLRPTGIGQYILNLLRCWQQEGRPLRALLPEQYLSAGPKAHSEIVRTPGHLARLGWNQFVLPTKLRKGEVLFNPVPEGSVLSPCPQVSTAHDVIPLIFPEFFPRKQAYFRYLVPACLRSSTHILCDSAQTRADLVRFYDLDPAKMSVVPLACDRSRFYPRPVLPERLARYELAPGNYFFYVGAHEPHKNLARLIEAFAQVAGEWPGVLAIAGAFDPRYTPALVRLTEKLQIAHRVRWLDYLDPDDLPCVYSAAHAFVFPSLYEGFGLPVLEAMACGTAVLASARGSLAEVTGEAAVLVEAECPDAIADGMRQLLEPAVRADYRARGLAQAQRFSWERTARTSWELIDKAREET